MSAFEISQKSKSIIDAQNLNYEVGLKRIEKIHTELARAQSDLEKIKEADKEESVTLAHIEVAGSLGHLLRYHPVWVVAYRDNDDEELHEEGPMAYDEALSKFKERNVHYWCAIDLRLPFHL